MVTDSLPRHGISPGPFTGRSNPSTLIGLYHVNGDILKKPGSGIILLYARTRSIRTIKKVNYFRFAITIASIPIIAAPRVTTGITGPV